jgi:hypothetical protein
MSEPRIGTMLRVLEASSHTSGIGGFQARNDLISSLEDRLFSQQDNNVVDTLPRIILRKLEQTDDTVSACPICLTDYFEGRMVVQVVQLPCTHCFCENCAREWLVRQQTCPLCRQVVNDATPGASNEVPSLSIERREADSIWEARHQQRRRDWQNGTDGEEVGSADTLLADAVAEARQRRRVARSHSTAQPASHQALVRSSGGRSRTRTSGGGQRGGHTRGPLSRRFPDQSSRTDMQQIYDLRRNDQRRDNSRTVTAGRNADGAAGNARVARGGLQARAKERLAELQQMMRRTNDDSAASGSSGAALRRYEARNARQAAQSAAAGPAFRYFASA